MNHRKQRVTRRPFRNRGELNTIVAPRRVSVRFAKRGTFNSVALKTLEYLWSIKICCDAHLFIARPTAGTTLEGVDNEAKQKTSSTLLRRILAALWTLSFRCLGISPKLSPSDVRLAASPWERMGLAARAQNYVKKPSLSQLPPLRSQYASFSA